MLTIIKIIKTDSALSYVEYSDLILRILRETNVRITMKIKYVSTEKVLIIRLLTLTIVSRHLGTNSIDDGKGFLRQTV
jgi:hypothetical protein